MNTVSSANYYAFVVGVLVPPYLPKGSLQDFIVEFGTGNTLATRPYAGVLPSPKINALMDAEVLYETNIESREQVFTFKGQTTTALVTRTVASYLRGACRTDRCGENRFFSVLTGAPLVIITSKEPY